MSKAVVILFFVTALSACGGPVLIFAGGALSGQERPLTTADLPKSDVVFQLETRPNDPYSVNLNGFAIDGGLYVDPTAERAWGQHLAADPNIRVRLTDGVVLTATAERVTDPNILKNFDADRIIYAIVPRTD